MYAVRGRVRDRDRDLAPVEWALDRAGEGTPAVRVWSPARQVAFGRRDARAGGYDRARRAARERGFPPTERSVGGRAVAYTGRTVAFAYAVPVAAAGRTALDERYDRVTRQVREGLAAVDAELRPGEPPNAFCPGEHSLRAGGKVVGIAQRVRKRAALVSGVVVVADREAIAEVLTPVYDALGVPFDPGSVGSVAAAGGPSDPVRVARALEDALVGDRERTVRDASVVAADRGRRVDGVARGRSSAGR